MTPLAIIGLTLIALFATFLALTRLHIEEARKTGVLRQRGPGSSLRKPILRDVEPELFDQGIRSLRTAPWIAACLVSFALLLCGLVL